MIRPDALSKATTAGSPSALGPVPLCPVGTRHAPATGELLIGEKQPNHAGSAPYCYRIYYVVPRGESLSMHADDGRELAPLASSDAAVWAKMRTTLSRYIDAHHADNPGRHTSAAASRATAPSGPHVAPASAMG